jgi:hypothetical protein
MGGRALVSPGRLGRVVTETDRVSSGSRSSSPRAMLVLPAPDGDDSTSIRPRRLMMGPLAEGLALDTVAPGTLSPPDPA